MMLGSFDIAAHPKTAKGWGVVLVALCSLIGCGGGGGKSTPKCTSTFNACGGDPTGTWDITAYCMEGDLVAEYNELSSPACAGLFRASAISEEGSISYTAAEVTYNTVETRAVKAAYTPACAAATFKIDTLDSASCKEVEADNADNAPENPVTCAYTGGNCVCDRLSTSAKTSKNAFTVDSGGTIIEDYAGDYEFCVSGPEMVQRRKYYGDVYIVTTLRKR